MLTLPTLKPDCIICLCPESSVHNGPADSPFRGALFLHMFVHVIGGSTGGFGWFPHGTVLFRVFPEPRSQYCRETTYPEI